MYQSQEDVSPSLWAVVVSPSPEPRKGKEKSCRSAEKQHHGKRRSPARRERGAGLPASRCDVGVWVQDRRAQRPGAASDAVAGAVW